MSDASAIDDDDDRLDEGDEVSRDEAILDELAELGLALARGLQERALAAEKADQAASLANAFQGVARCVRQCLALKGKLRRDEAREDREHAREMDGEVRRRIRQRKAWVTMWIHRAIAEQTPEGQVDLARSRMEDLRDRLDNDVLDESFLDGDLLDVIATLHEAIGLQPPVREPPTRPPNARANGHTTWTDDPHPPDPWPSQPPHHDSG